MSCHSSVRDFVVGIDYDSIEEDKGHMTLRRKVSLDELIEEIRRFYNLVRVIHSSHPRLIQ